MQNQISLKGAHSPIKVCGWDTTQCRRLDLFNNSKEEEKEETKSLTEYIEYTVTIQKHWCPTVIISEYVNLVAFKEQQNFHHKIQSLEFRTQILVPPVSLNYEDGNKARLLTSSLQLLPQKWALSPSVYTLWGQAIVLGASSSLIFLGFILTKGGKKRERKIWQRNG